ncbi:AbiJ-NTD4 domain-containing protein [Pseudomonas syringae]|uniref:AbiJ-NTD4 domain-containing protein n=1 Tax=Pseudomonas syringae TaxID=317 RepID=UPI0004636A6A|nr:hypothetical protein [Pseudomonas syringae]UOF21938.1 hypothetical protein N023_10675 [Pseudomonas syringae CC440]UZA79521.1 hypothetical protein EZZ79_11155 [Pseudomonas syringae]
MEGDFSQRMGLGSASDVMQLSDMNKNLRTGLLNAAIECYLEKYTSSFPNTGMIQHSNLESFAKVAYTRFFKLRRDQIPSIFRYFHESICELFEKGAWHRVYSFIEFIITHAPNLNSKDDELTSSEDFINECNTTLRVENSAYRIVGGRVMQITSAEEVSEINSAIAANGFAGVNTHIRTALTMLTDRENPDYRNSIKESISAVESLAKQLTGNPRATLTPALSELERSHSLHPALKNAFSSLYGWTSDAHGIRHALMDVSNLTYADARFMLITCSAFINFAIDSTKD